MVALGRMKTEVAELVERPVFFADAVELADELLDVAGRVPVALLPLVFFAVEVFLLVGKGGVFTQLKARIDAVHRGEQGGEDRPDLKGGAAALL